MLQPKPHSALDGDQVNLFMLTPTAPQNAASPDGLPADSSTLSVAAGSALSKNKAESSGDLQVRIPLPPSIPRNEEKELWGCSRERLSNGEVPRTLHTSAHLVSHSGVCTHLTDNRNGDPSRQNNLSQRYIDYPQNSITGINLASKPYMHKNLSFLRKLAIKHFLAQMQYPGRESGLSTAKKPYNPSSPLLGFPVLFLKSHIYQVLAIGCPSSVFDSHHFASLSSN